MRGVQRPEHWRRKKSGIVKRRIVETRPPERRQLQGTLEYGVKSSCVVTFCLLFSINL